MHAQAIFSTDKNWILQKKKMQEKSWTYTWILVSYTDGRLNTFNPNMVSFYFMKPQPAWNPSKYLGLWAIASNLQLLNLKKFN